MSNRASQAAEYLSSQVSNFPTTALILGTGLGGFSEYMTVEKTIPYSAIPGFPISTVEGHAGQLIFGTAGSTSIVALKGRFHYYEGYSMEEVVLPIRVLHALGVKNLILSNASGGVNPDYKVGDIMMLSDHINLFPDNPLIGKNDDALGPRFPDMSQPYDRAFQDRFIGIAKEQSIDLKRGVYAGVTGPCYETPAEYRYLRIIGADAVGMSTVPETIAAVHVGMRVAALSVITDMGVEGQIEQISHEEVQRAAKASEPKLASLVTSFLTGIGS